MSKKKAPYIVILVNHNGVQDYLNWYSINNGVINFDYDYWAEYYRYPRWWKHEDAQEIVDLIKKQLKSTGRWAKIRVGKLRVVQKTKCKTCGREIRS